MKRITAKGLICRSINNILWVYRLVINQLNSLNYLLTNVNIIIDIFAISLISQNNKGAILKWNDINI